MHELGSKVGEAWTKSALAAILGSMGGSSGSAVSHLACRAATNDVVGAFECAAKHSQPTRCDRQLENAMAGNARPLTLSLRNSRTDLQMLARIVLRAKKSLKEPT